MRDRKTLYVMILVPLILMPALMLLGPIMGEREARKSQAVIYKVVLQGEENGPQLVNYLKKSGKGGVLS